MVQHRLLDRVLSCGVVAVMRGMEPEHVVAAARAIRAGGIEVLEVTVDAPGAFGMLEAVRAELAGEAVIGAGTVLDAATARSAIAAGAEFIFTPTLDTDVIRTVLRHGKVVIPGAMTPTEILTAFSAGAPAVKVFPAGVLGAEYIRQVRAPLPHIPLVPTGGVDAENAPAFIRAGAAAVGVGGALIDRQSIRRGELAALSERARRIVAAVAGARGGAG